MAKNNTNTDREIANFKKQVGIIDEVLHINVEGITHGESLVQPRPGGNCLNWVVGHLLWTYNYNLPVFGQQPVVEKGTLERYARGKPPLKNEDEAISFEELMKIWAVSDKAIKAGLNKLHAVRLDQPAKRNQSDESNETIRERITGVLFHQTYHVGQTGLLRRLIGKDGAIT